MSGLFGWLSGDPLGIPPEAVASRMARVLAPGTAGSPGAVAASTHGLAVYGDTAEASWYEADGLYATVVGYPRWTDQALQEKARHAGPAAALAEAYRRYDQGLLEHLLGHFVVVVLDPKRRRVFAAVDRFGVYRLCYAAPERGRLAFATSADSVRAFPGMGATISPQTLYQYLFFVDRVAAPGTIYDEQKKLRPGEALWLEDGELRCWRYWQLDYRKLSSAPRDELFATLRSRLHDAVAHSVEGESGSRIGCFLSGGLDSSSVAYYLSKVAGDRGHCATIGFQHADFDETRFARIAAEAFGLSHEVFAVGPDEVLAAIGKLSSCYDEPYSNSSVIPCFYCAKVTREAGAEVILAGDGGDELFGGNTRYLKDGVFDHYQRLPSVLRRHVLEPVLAHLPRAARVTLLRRARSYVSLARRSVADRMTSQNVFAEVAIDRVFSREAAAAIDPNGPTRFAERLYAETAGDAKIQKMMNLDLQLTLADSDLRKVLTSCAAAGIRVRFPMLDDDLAGFSASVPPRLLTEGGRIRQFYKEALRDVLPREIIAKPKQGFGLPMFQYIAESPPLAEFFCDALRDLTRRSYFSPAFLATLVEAVHKGQPGIHSGIVWDLAVLETWMAAR